MLNKPKINQKLFIIWGIYLFPKCTVLAFPLSYISVVPNFSATRGWFQKKNCLAWTGRWRGGDDFVHNLDPVHVQMKFRLLVCHLHRPVLNRPWTSARIWELLLYITQLFHEVPDLTVNQFIYCNESLLARENFWK